jgi:hypothetical protein
MNRVYAVAGVSRQAHHQHGNREAARENLVADLVAQVDELRADHPGCGLEKVHRALQPEGMGRDRFVALFQSLGYGVVKRKNYQRSTIPTHVRFPNLITGMALNGPDQLWQSDITYFEVNGRFYYLVFITDAFTKVIKGFAVSDHLRAEANIKALRMAFRSSPGNLEGLIHHSDRGSQYTDKEYQRLLTRRGIHISMGLTAQDNAYAERVNGTIKNEYLSYWSIQNFSQLAQRVARAVRHYNAMRPHNRLPQRSAPQNFETKCLSLSDQDKLTVIVYAEGNDKLRRVSNSSEFRPRTRPLAHACPIVTS